MNGRRISGIARASRINRRYWNAMAPRWGQWVDSIGLTSRFFGRGGVTFESPDSSEQVPPAARRRIDALIRSLAGNVRGKQVVDLQCGAGEATLAWANLGARVTGVDLADERVATARTKAAEAGIEARFVRADVSRLPFGPASFDLVYTGGGVIGWLPDLNSWGREIGRVLKRGGRFVLYDTHPLVRFLDWKTVGSRRPTLAGDYFDQVSRVYGNAKDWPDQAETKWKLSDVVNALTKAGLVVRHMEELPKYTRRPSKTRVRFPYKWILSCQKP